MNCWFTMMPNTPNRRLLLPAIVIPLLLAACGGAKSEGSTPACNGDAGVGVPAATGGTELSPDNLDRKLDAIERQIKQPVR